MLYPTTIFGVDTPRGFRTAELLNADVTALDFRADILVLSAFAGGSGYHPAPGSMMGALKSVLNISVAAFEERPALDLREALGVWVSEPMEVDRFGRMLCVEMVGGALPLKEAIENVFAALMLLAAKRIATDTVVLPMLGAGYQGLNPARIAPILVSSAKRYLYDAPATKRLAFVELDGEKAERLGDAIENELGRAKVTLPQEQVVTALRQDVMQRMLTAESLFAPDCLSIRDQWMHILGMPDARSAEFGIASRKLVELLLSRMGTPAQVLAKRIRDLEQRGDVAPWICGYMNVLRHLGNDSAHQSLDSTKRHPPVIAPSDLTAGLFCIRRLLEFWIDRPTVANREHH